MSAAQLADEGLFAEAHREEEGHKASDRSTGANSSGKASQPLTAESLGENPLPCKLLGSQALACGGGVLGRE